MDNAVLGSIVEIMSSNLTWREIVQHLSAQLIYQISVFIFLVNLYQSVIRCSLKALMFVKLWSNFYNLKHFAFSFLKKLDINTEIHTILIGIANMQDPDQTASSEAV